MGGICCGQLYSRMQEGSGAFGARVQAAIGQSPWRLRFSPGSASPSGLVQRVVIKPTPWRQSERLQHHFIAAKGGDTKTLGPKGPLPPERSEHNLLPSGSHNLRGQRPRPPSPLNPLNQPAAGGPNPLNPGRTAAPSVYQNAGIRPSLKLSLIYFFTDSLWKIFTNFW